MNIYIWFEKHDLFAHYIKSWKKIINSELGVLVDILKFLIPGLEVGKDKTLLEIDRWQQLNDNFGFVVKHFVGQGVVIYNPLELFNSWKRDCFHLKFA